MAGELHLHLGASAEGRKKTLEQMAADANAIGYRRRPSISELIGRIADAADFDYDQAMSHVNGLMNLAAQSYVVSSEEEVQAAVDDWRRNGAYRTERAAKRAAGDEPAVVVRFVDGSFAWFPAGAPIATVHDGRITEFAADQYQVVARRVAGRGWVATNQ